MGQTATYGLPYAGPDDPPNGPQQQQALAVATDTALGVVETSLDGRVDALENNTAVGPWQNLILESGFTTFDGRTPQVRVWGSLVWLRGAIAASSGGIPGFTALAYMPTEAVLTQKAGAAIAVDHAGARSYTAARLIIYTNGRIEIADQDPGGDPGWIALDGVTYWID